MHQLLLMALILFSLRFPYRRSYLYFYFLLQTLGFKTVVGTVLSHVKTSNQGELFILMICTVHHVYTCI